MNMLNSNETLASMQTMDLPVGVAPIVKVEYPDNDWNLEEHQFKKDSSFKSDFTTSSNSSSNSSSPVVSKRK